MGGIARTFPVLWLLFSFTKSPPARKFVGGRSGSGTTRPRARPRAECSTDSRCRSKPVVMAPQCKPRNGRAPSTPRVSSSSPQVRPAAVVPPRSVSSGKHSSAAESPASVPFSTLTFTYSQPLRAHALLRGELCTLPHICAALVYDFGWESHVQTTHCVAFPHSCTPAVRMCPALALASQPNRSSDPTVSLQHCPTRVPACSSSARSSARHVPITAAPVAAVAHHCSAISQPTMEPRQPTVSTTCPKQHPELRRPPTCAGHGAAPRSDVRLLPV